MTAKLIFLLSQDSSRRSVLLSSKYILIVPISNILSRTLYDIQSFVLFTFVSVLFQNKWCPCLKCSQFLDVMFMSKYKFSGETISSMLFLAWSYIRINSFKDGGRQRRYGCISGSVPYGCLILKNVYKRMDRKWNAIKYITYRVHRTSCLPLILQK